MQLEVKEKQAAAARDKLLKTIGNIVHESVLVHDNEVCGPGGGG